METKDTEASYMPGFGRGLSGNYHKKRMWVPEYNKLQASGLEIMDIVKEIDSCEWRRKMYPKRTVIPY